MTIPANKLHDRVVVERIAKIPVAMTMQARAGQADSEKFFPLKAVNVYVPPNDFPRASESAAYANFSYNLPERHTPSLLLGLYGRLGRCPRGAAIPDRKSDQGEEGNKPSEDHITITHSLALLPGQRLAAQVGRPLSLALHGDFAIFPNSCNCPGYSRHPVFEQWRQGRLVDGANARQKIDSIFLLHVFHELGARKSASQAHLESIVTKARSRTCAREWYRAFRRSACKPAAGCSAVPQGGPWRAPRIAGSCGRSPSNNHCGRDRV